MVLRISRTLITLVQGIAEIGAVITIEEECQMWGGTTAVVFSNRWEAAFKVILWVAFLVRKWEVCSRMVGFKIGVE